MDQFLELLSGWGIEYGPKIGGSIAIIILGRIVTGMVVSLVVRLLKRSKADPTLTQFVASITRTALKAFIFIAAISNLGVETTSFVAILGAAGLAIALSMQSSLGNLASGVMLITFRPFKAGDFVEAGGAIGVVEEVSIFNTVFKTGDNKKIIVPNGSITGGSITNYSANDTRRIDMVFGIGYDDDLKKAKSILERLVNEDSRILKDPAPVIVVGELADSSVNFNVRPWVKSSDYWGVYWDMMEKVKLTFDAEGISIPYPQQDVHMHQVTAA